MEPPVLTTPRLVLRPFQPADAPDVQRLAGERDVAATTILVPHPYELSHAEEWIKGMDARHEKGDVLELAITRGEDGVLVGAIGLTFDKPNESAELGYWIGKPFWGHGYCTEAAQAVVHYAFDTLGLNRVMAKHFPHNPASGRVLQKVGMSCEGRQVQAIKKWGQFVDVVLYGMVRKERKP